MNMVYVGVRNEFQKLFYLKGYKAILVFLFVFSIGIGVLGNFSKGYIGLSLTNTPFTILSIATGLLLPLIIALAAADLFTAEQENGTIRAVITKPISRTNIFISKILAIVLYVLLALLLCLMTSLAWNVLMNGVSSSTILGTFLSYAVSILPMLPMILFAVAISQVCRNSSSTVMLTILGYLAILGLGIVMPNISPMLFLSHIGWYKLFLGTAIPITNIFNVLALFIAYGLIFFAAGAWIFEKKEY